MPAKAKALATLTGLAASAVLAYGPAFAHPHPPEAPPESGNAQASSPFVGRYDGSRMETALGMAIHPDGTFAWGLSVGALDLRAQGTWFEEDGTIIFVSDPRPVAPKFGWSGMERVSDGPLVRVIWSTNGQPFRHSSIYATCSNGETVFDQVPANGWSPPEECDKVQTIQLRFDVYDVVSETYDLVKDFPVEDGETIRFDFQPNDMGVADFNGAMGQIIDGTLVIEGPLGRMEMRKEAN